MWGAGKYRYGFNGKEKEESGEWGELTHYDYGFRIYNPGIGKFLSRDPLAYSYPELTPYQFASNTPIWAADLDGLEAEYRTDGSIWYNVRPKEGFTQIVNELALSGTLIEWTALRDNNPETACQITGCERDDPGNKQYNTNNNLNPGDYLFVGYYETPEPAVAISPPARGRDPFIKNKAIEIGVGGSLFGGFGISAGLVFDENGDYGVFISPKLKLGVGGGVGLEISDINPTTTAGFLVDDFAGTSTTYNGGIGIFGVSYGGDTENPSGRSYFTDFGKTYTTGTFSPDVSGKNLKVRPKLKAKVSLEGTVDFDRTYLLYNSRNTGSDEN